jgi:UDP-N-acetylmuramoylalanine--D-glutamate ligase
MVMTLEKTEFAGKRIAVVGMARTGLAVAPILTNLGASVLLSDSQDRSDLGSRFDDAAYPGVTLLPGAGPEEALQNAEIVIPSPGIKPSSPILQLARQRGLTILSEIEVAYRFCKAPIIAVTGTNGKTTTTMMLGEIMRTAGKKTWIAGNIAADELKQALIDAAYRADHGDVIVAEISSFQLMWVEKFRPAVGVLTNITPDHLNWHESFAEYAGAKARIFAAQGENDVAVINALNAPARAIGEFVPSRLFWFDHGHCKKEDSSCVRDGRIVVRWNGAEHVMCRADALNVPGYHNVENALAAAGAAIAFGIAPDAVDEALLSFRGVVHRMEHVGEIDGVNYINNSMCTNIDAAVRSLEAMDRPTIVISGGAGKNTDFAPLGHALSQSAKHAILIGTASEAIEAAAHAAGFTAISHAETMDEAVETAVRLATRGDAVMLSPACASFDMFADFEARGEAFRNAVRKRMNREE